MNSVAAPADKLIHLRESHAGRRPMPRTDDMDMIRKAAELTRDLNAPNPMIYWADFLISVFVGYAAMAIALSTHLWGGPFCVAFLVSVLALYRAGSFTHEITHIKHSAVPGFRFAWNALMGIPMLVPSFMYEGVHNLHHAKTRYGTVDDPEYLPLACMMPWTVPFFVVVSILAPLGLLIRYGVIAPLSALVPPLRKLVVERYSGMVINPEFRRRLPEGEARRNWIVQETAASIWAIVVIASVASGFVALKPFLIVMGIAAASIVLNQVRTLVAHLWENEGEVMSVTAQYLDSVNVPPPATLPMLWAPVGLRYHALHHLLPGLPYHALGEAHRRISAVLPQQSTYHDANYRSLAGLIVRLMQSARGTR